MFDGVDLGGLSTGELKGVRRRAQYIFQDALSSLSPRKTIADLVTEPYRAHSIASSEQYSVAELLEQVGLTEEHAAKYPHQLSGGQARRVSIARALALRPELLIADEPTAGLDVSAAAAIVNLLADLHARHHLAYLIITHDLKLLGYLAHRIAVMYLGRIVEFGSADDILISPRHPYTRALLAAASKPDPRNRLVHRLLLPGEIPSPRQPPPGCTFHTRCQYAVETCRSLIPELDYASTAHQVACHRWRELDEQPSQSPNAGADDRNSGLMIGGVSQP